MPVYSGFSGLFGCGAPRPGLVKSSVDERPPDRIAIAVPAHAFPPELVNAVVGQCGRGEQRNRLLPA